MKKSEQNDVSAILQVKLRLHLPQNSQRTAKPTALLGIFQNEGKGVVTSAFFVFRSCIGKKGRKHSILTGVGGDKYQFCKQDKISALAVSQNTSRCGDTLQKRQLQIAK